MTPPIPSLNEDNIKAAVELLSMIDYSKTTIPQLEEILTPIITGYKINTPKFDKGLRIHRGIKYNDKPTHLKHLSYPPNNIARIGRANDDNQSIFYGATDKTVPFFELRLTVGDTFALSTWETNKELILNHIGFTNDVIQELNSQRELDSIYDFVKKMQDFGNLNEYVYNYLGGVFSKQVIDSNYYKLTVAITNKLMIGDFFGGILYPTIQMFGNADNLALKPTFVDTGLDFISVEYLKITDVDGKYYTFETLDTSNTIKNDGTIDWSGKTLGWDIKDQLKIKSNGIEYIALDENNTRINPYPTNPILTNTPIYTRFTNSFENTYKITNDFIIHDPAKETIGKVTLHISPEKEKKFLSVYIPKTANPLTICISILHKYDELTTLDKGISFELQTPSGESIFEYNTPYELDPIVHIFSETYIDLEQVSNHFNKKINNSRWQLTPLGIVSNYVATGSKSSDL